MEWVDVGYVGGSMLLSSVISLFLLTCLLLLGELPGLIVHRAKLAYGMMIVGIVSNGAWVNERILIYAPSPRADARPVSI